MGERTVRLEVIERAVANCTRCRLHETRTKTVFARGNPEAELVFVGEGPGEQEDVKGEPFVGAAGKLLDKMITAMGYGRDEVYICNVVKCRPPQNRKPQADEVTACRPYLVEQLALVRPRVIVALGTTPMQALLRTKDGIMKLRGIWKLYGQIPVMPTFHPAYLLRVPERKPDVWEDLCKVAERLGRTPGTAP